MIQLDPDFSEHGEPPRRVEVCGELTNTPTQKVKKQELRASGINAATWQAPPPERQRRGGRQPDQGGVR